MRLGLPPSAGLESPALTVSVVVDNTTDMLSTRPPYVTSELRVLFAAGMRELAGEGLCSAHFVGCKSLVLRVSFYLLVAVILVFNLLPFFCALVGSFRPSNALNVRLPL